MCHLYIYLYFSVAFIVFAATMFMVNKDYQGMLQFAKI